jgi:hypothetical protein
MARSNYQENFQQALTEVRQMTTREIKRDLHSAPQWHIWYVDALAQVLQERQEAKPNLAPSAVHSIRPSKGNSY